MWVAVDVVVLTHPNSRI